MSGIQTNLVLLGLRKSTIACQSPPTFRVNCVLQIDDHGCAMLSISPVLERMNAIDPLRPLHEPSSPKRYAVDAGDCLYTQADARGAAFKIEQGAFTVFRCNVRRPSEFIETAIIGDVIGLGCSDRYADNARAIVSSIVCSLPSAQVNELAKTDPAFRLKQIDAIEREFQYRKELSSIAAEITPLAVWRPSYYASPVRTSTKGWILRLSAKT